MYYQEFRLGGLCVEDGQDDHLKGSAAHNVIADCSEIRAMSTDVVDGTTHSPTFALHVIASCAWAYSDGIDTRVLSSFGVLEGLSLYDSLQHGTIDDESDQNR